MTERGENPGASDESGDAVGPVDAPLGPEGIGAAEPRPDRRRRRRRIIGWTMIAVGVVILGSAAWVGWRSYQAYSHLEQAAQQVSTLQDQLSDITAIDPATTESTVADLQAEAGAARSAVDDPIFRAATVLPFLGPNLGAIREVAVTVDELATDVMPSLVDVAATLRPDQLAPTDGAIDLAPILSISPLLQNADSAVDQARDRMAAIDRTAVVQPVADAVVTVWRKLDQAAGVIEPAARIARLLPPMLGSDGPRTYLVVFQNPAELRATGGIFGSYAVVQADQGKISLADQGASSRTLGFFDPPVAQLTPEQIHLYSQLMAQYPQDVNFTPDFPTAAPLFTEMYRLRTGSTVDGVLAIDPVALSYLLQGAAPIDVGDGVSITADNLVDILLSTAYQKFDNGGDQTERDAFLAAATARVFSDVMSGQGNARMMLDGLRTAIGERRIMVYSSAEQEQKDIVGTGVSGAVDVDPEQPSIGVYMNDGTAAKLGYYLTNEVQVTEGECRADGRRELKVRVVMNYQAPPAGLPDYVTGASATALLRTNVLVFAPLGGAVLGVERDGVTTGMGRGEDHGREVGTTTVELDPGASTDLVYTVLGPPSGAAGADVEPTLDVTPGVTTWPTSVEAYRDCG